MNIISLSAGNTSVSLAYRHSIGFIVERIGGVSRETIVVPTWEVRHYLRRASCASKGYRALAESYL